jgi:glycine C-acetyltransferase
VRQADTDAAIQYGAAYPMGARMMSGHTKYHEQLENGWHEGCGLLTVGHDVSAHACIIDGVRLHSGKDILTSTMILKVWKKNCNVLQNGY